jgi:MFS family permease
VNVVGGDKAFLGYIISIFSIGRLIASLIFGWWSERHGTRLVLLFSMLLSICGSFVYCLAALYRSKMLVLIGRLLMGLGTGNFSIVRSYIASITSKEERTKYLGWGGAMQFIGFALMPWIAGLFSFCKRFTAIRTFEFFYLSCLVSNLHQSCCSSINILPS